MSDAKAKAAARREKILKRDSSRLLVAKGEKDGIEEGIESVKKERPLASRRNLISSPSSSNMLEGLDSTTDEPKEPTDATQDPEVESIDDFQNIKKNESMKQKSVRKIETPEPVEAASVKDLNNSEDLSPTPKSTKELENKIREQTAEFDKKVLKKETSTTKSKSAKPIQIKAPVAPLQDFHIMKFVRIFAIVIMGIIIGRRSYSYHGAKVALISKSYRSPTGICQVGDVCPVKFIPESTLVPPPNPAADIAVDKSQETIESTNQDIRSADDEYIELLMKTKISFSTANADGTWLGWIQAYLVRQAESTITAINLAWWIARLVNPIVSTVMKTSMFKSNNPTKESILQKLLNIYGNGIEGVIYSSMGTFGELALQFVAVIVTCMAIAFLNENPLFLDELVKWITDMINTTLTATGVA